MAGHFLVGVLRSGDLFLWHKDTDMLKYIQGLPELAQTLPNASNNANRPHAPTGRNCDVPLKNKSQDFSQVDFGIEIELGNQTGTIEIIQ